MNLFQKIKEVKLPFIAVIAALTFGGIVAPASAIAYASNSGSVEDPDRSYSYYSALTLDSNGQADIEIPANNNRLALSLNYYLDQAQSDSFAGQQLSFEFSIVKTGTTTAGSIYVPNPIVTNNNQNLTLTGTGTSSTVIWPSGAASNSTAQRISFWPYANSAVGTAGTYTVTFKAKMNGQVIVPSGGSSFNASVETGLSGAVSGTLPAGKTLKDITSGNVCVNPSQIAVGDVLTARAIANGTVLTNNNAYSYSFWRHPSTSVANTTNTRTVVSADITEGLAFETRTDAYAIQSAGGTVPVGAAFTYDLSITKADGTEVTYPCPASTPAAPVITASSSTGVTMTTSGATNCRIGMLIQQSFFQPMGFGSVLNNSCSITPFSLTFQPGTYTVKAVFEGFWGMVESTGNPTVTINANGTASIGGSSNSQISPSVPTPRVTASVRPLPQINFATSPVNGVSARPTADTRKGTLSIEGSNLSDLTSITIGGKAATFTVKDGKLEIKLPAGVTGFPEVVMTNASGSITMQNAIEIYAPTVQKLTKFVGERLTLAGMETLENLYINNKTATALEATVVVAPDATEAEIAKAVAAATKAVTYIDKVGKRIVRTAVEVSKTGAAGTKPTIEMSFTK